MRLHEGGCGSMREHEGEKDEGGCGSMRELSKEAGEVGKTFSRRNLAFGISQGSPELVRHADIQCNSSGPTPPGFLPEQPASITSSIWHNRPCTQHPASPPDCPLPSFCAAPACAQAAVACSLMAVTPMGRQAENNSAAVTKSCKQWGGM